VLEVLYHHAKFGGARISPGAGVAKNVVFLSVLLAVCSSRSSERCQCRPGGAGCSTSILIFISNVPLKIVVGPT